MDHAHTHKHTQEFSGGISKFLPLIVIFLFILAFTALMVVRQGSFDLLFAMRMFMAGFFLVFGAFKVVKWRAFADAYQVYDIIAKRSRTYAYAYPLIELSLGFAYLFGWSLLATNIVTLFVMSVGAIGVGKELLKGEEIICACLGTVFRVPMTKVTLFEDLLMAAMALWMITILV